MKKLKNSKKIWTHSYRYTLTVGDLTAKVEHNRKSEKYIGSFDEEERNERGERLAVIAETSKFFIANSFFKKTLGKR